MTHWRQADILSFPTRVRPPLNYYPIMFILSLGATKKKRVLQGTVVLRTQYPARVPLFRIAAQKAAATASQADLASVARLKASRTAGLSPAARSAGAGKSGLAHDGPQRGGVLRTAQTGSTHTPNRKPNWSHSANPVEGDLPRHQIGARMIVKGRRGNNRVKG